VTAEKGLLPALRLCMLTVFHGLETANTDMVLSRSLPQTHSAIHLYDGLKLFASACFGL
jgi:hypothetical protein